jgi:serine/threonine protein kinase
VHRDLKPANVLLDAYDPVAGPADGGLPFIPKVSDFGVARALEDGVATSRTS